MGKASRDKGKRGERELASILTEHGYNCRRTAQYCGNTGDASDVVGLPGIHIECKRVERLSFHDAVKQAERDCKGDRLPALFSKRNNEPWLVTMKMDDWIAIYREWEAGKRPTEQEETG